MVQKMTLTITIVGAILSLTGCKTTNYSVVNSSDDVGSSIFLKVLDSRSSGVTLMAATPENYDQLWACPNQKQCDEKNGELIALTEVVSGRAFFRFPKPLEVSAGVTLSLLAKSTSHPEMDPLTRVVKFAETQDSPSKDYDWVKNIELVDVPRVSRSCDVTRYKRFYCDVMTHTKKPYLGSGDTATDVHETQHFMAHEVTRPQSKFIYFEGGKGAFFPEPRTSTGGISDKILFKSGMYYKTYITSRPTQALGENIMDEWRAYITEEISGIERGDSEGLGIGGVEFLYYCAAMIQGLDEKEPGYLQNKQGIAVFAMLAELVNEWTIKQGIEKDFFSQTSTDRARKILSLLRSDPAHAGMRQTLIRLYGANWTDRVLGFSG